MKIKTSELIDDALDWAVAKAEYADGRTISIQFGCVLVHTAPGSGIHFSFQPSTAWSQGGPIIDREKISLVEDGYNRWLAGNADTNPGGFHLLGQQIGPTPLVAAMRCFVASKLGESVDAPEELCQ